MKNPDVTYPYQKFPKRDRVAHFWSKVDRRGPDECWPFLGGQKNGYGWFQDGKFFEMRAHRFAWMLHNGPFPDDKPFALHSCDNRICVNPAHVRPGTHKNNRADAMARGRAVICENQHVNKTHCIRGHELSPQNIWIAGSGIRGGKKKKKYRICKQCYYEKKAERFQNGTL